MFHCLYKQKNCDAYLISMMLLVDRYSLLLQMMMIRLYLYLYHLFLLMDMLLSMHCLNLSGRDYFVIHNCNLKFIVILWGRQDIVKCNVLHSTSLVSYVTRHYSHNIRYMSHIARNMSHNSCYTTYDSCHTAYDSCYTTYVT